MRRSSPQSPPEPDEQGRSGHETLLDELRALLGEARGFALAELAY